MLWGFTPAESEPWLEYRLREVLFREAVLAFFGLGPERKASRRDQSPGERCCGADMDECRAYFGDEEVLKRVCATCPD